MSMVAILLAGSLIVGFLGRKGKFGFWGYFFASMLLTPLIGFLLVLSSSSGSAVPPPPSGKSS